MLRKFIYSLVSKIRNISLDPQIPSAYLIRLLSGKIVNRIYGSIRLLTIRGVFLSPSAILRGSSCFKFGRNLMIGPRCYIDALGIEGITCGDGVSFGIGTTMIVTGSLQQLGKGIRIGNNVGLGTCGHYGGAGGLEIGDDTIIGNYVSIHPENHNFKDLDIPIRLQGVNHKGIKIGKGCWIGAKSTILDGTQIGNGCIVAAGAVVSGIFPDNVIIGGIPARIIKTRE